MAAFEFSFIRKVYVPLVKDDKADATTIGQALDKLLLANMEGKPIAPDNEPGQIMSVTLHVEESDYQLLRDMYVPQTVTGKRR